MVFNTMDYIAAKAALESAQADISVAEFHGTFCALVCTRAPVDSRAWVSEIVHYGPDAPGAPDALWRECLTEIGDLACVAFEGGECDLEILLPDDDQTLIERGQALVDWCSGFLYGFGLQPQAVLTELSADAREVFDDIVEFTHMDVVSGAEEGQVAEKAYFEIVEYLRVGVLLIYEENIHGAEAALADSGPVH